MGLATHGLIRPSVYPPMFLPRCDGGHTCKQNDDDVPICVDVHTFFVDHEHRLQVGADADITIFDPKTIIDRADFKGLQFSEGVEYVLINGELVVSDGKNVENVFPGRAVMGKYRR